MKKLRKLGKRMLSLVLVLALVLGLVPQNAYASQNQKPETPEHIYESEGCTITYKESSAWGNYVNADITIKNEGEKLQANWQLSLDYDGMIDNIWNADILSSENGKSVIECKTYNSVIEPGQSVSFGFTAHGADKKPDAPADIRLVKDTPPETGTEDKKEEGTQDFSIPEKWKGLNYALFTSGDETLSLYTNETNITGDVHSNRGFYYQGTKLTVNGTVEAAETVNITTSSGADCQKVAAKKEQADTVEMPDITSEVYDYSKEHGRVYDQSKSFDSNSLVVEKPVVVEGDVSFNATTFLGKGIVYAKDSITYNVGSLSTPEDSRVLLASENGNITLNGSEINMNGVLYAPDGCVSVNANHFTLNGRIIAKQVRINGTLININAGPYDFDMLDFLFKPEVDLKVEGNRKENRKLVLDVEEIQNVEYIKKEDIVWNISRDGSEVKDAYAFDEDASSELHKEMIFRQAGTYQVSVTVTTGKVDYTVTKEIIIEKDLNPLAAFALGENYYSRDKKGNAKITVADASASPDGDEIGQRIWTVYYDKNNNGKFEDSEAEVYSDSNETKLVIDTDKVGKYKVLLTTVETFTDTIPKLITDEAFLRGDTSAYSNSACVFEVGNEAPEARLSVEKSKSADIVFTLGDADKETASIYSAKAEALKKILEEKGVDARIDVASSKTLTAQDTFAWEEFSHYNSYGYENHILYEGNDIKMVGYPMSAEKDFLYISDDHPGRKTFEFDIQKDANDWHSIEGGGFLFNTTVSREKDTIQGFCILVAYDGLRLVQIDCKELSAFRHGEYRFNYVQRAGKLLKTFKIENVFASHHFRIVVDKKTLSVWDGDTLVIDNFILPDNDYGFGFGPITGHVWHDCAQLSYFTFKNITMETSTGKSLADIVAGYDWRPGASHYVINLSRTEVPELANEEMTADLAAALAENEAAFIGIGNENNEGQFTSLLNATGCGGMYTDIGTAGTTMDVVNNYLTDSVLAKDYSVGQYLTTDDIISYGGYYRDAENDPVYEEQWEYEYDPTVFGDVSGKMEHIVKKVDKPITTFTETGAYVIRLKVRDNPAGDNDALDEYRKWSGTDEYKKLVIVQSRPVAEIDVKVTKNKKDSKTCTVKTTYSAKDADHPKDSKKGIRKESFAYKNVKDADWTEGRMPNSVTAGETYLVKYQVKDMEGTWSFPAVSVVKTRDFLEYEEIEDNTPPEIFITTSKSEVKVGDPFRIDGYSLDDYGTDSFTLYVEGKKELDAFGRVFYTPVKAGTITIKAVAVDIGGNRSEKEVTVKVVDDSDVTEPTAVITSPKSGSELDFNVQIKGTAEDETKFGKYTLAYKKDTESEYHVFKESDSPVHEDVLGTLDISRFTDGTYEILLTVEDAAGNVSTYGLLLYVKTGKTDPDAPEETTKKVFSVSLSHSTADTGTEVQIMVTLPENVSEDSVVIKKEAETIAEGSRKASFTSEEPGTVTITASGVTEDGEAVTADAECVFHDMSDQNAPEAEITTPEAGEILSAPVDITGTADDAEGLDFWKLEYRLEDEKDYTLVNEGKEPVKKGVLGKLDTTMLMNGQYVLRLTVQDKGGNRKRIERTCLVEGGLKIGNMHIGFTDLTAKMGGTNISVNRIYDSRNKAAGDFGTGWTLGLQGMSLYESADIWDGYELVQTGSLFSKGYQMKETKSHDVTVAYGDGTSDRFELAFTPERRALIPITEVTLGYRCVTNPKVKLEILGDTTAMVADNGISFFSEAMYDDLSYRLTTEEGAQVYIHSKKGVYKITDTDGSAITVDRNGYHSENGKSITFTRDEKDRITKAEDPAGNTVTYSYDDRNDLVSVTDAAERTVSFTYDKAHNLISITDPSGTAVARNEYDDGGRLVATVDADGNRMEYTHDVDGRTEVVSDRLGNKTVYIYDDHGNVLSTTDANGKTTKSTYDSLGNVLSKTDANGNVTTYAYDESGNMTAVTDADGNTVENTYDSSNRVTSMKTLGDTEILIDYDSRGNLAETTDAEGNRTEYSYDPEGNVTGITDGLGTVMSAKYDREGNVTESTDSAGNKITSTYDENGNRLTQTTYVVTENGTRERTTRYVYNPAGELVQTVDADGNVTSVERNENGKMSAAVDSKGRRTEYAYDSRGNVTRITYSDGTTETFEYDAEDRNTKTVGRTGLATTYSYDRTGNLLKQTDARGNTVSYTYDGNYNLLSVTDATGAVTTYTYDKLNRNTSITDDAGNVTEFTYNGLSLLVSIRDAKGNVTEYGYDGNGNRTKVIYPDKTTTETGYDQRGRTIWQKDAEGQKTEYTYDGSDRLTAVEQPDGAVTEYTYDQKGNLTAVKDANGNTTKYEYDTEGRRTATIPADGSRSTSRYDRQGLLTETVDYNGVKTAYTYDGQDRIIKEQTGDEYTSYEYDAYGRLAGLRTKGSEITYTYNKYGELDQKTYENGEAVKYLYDRYGRTSEIQVLSGEKVQASTKYEYDRMNRLTRVVGRNGEATVYTYDACGNRETATFANGVKLTYTYDGLNRLTLQKAVDSRGETVAQYQYTLGKNGQRTRTEEEGPEGTVTTDYRYDEANRLVKETIRTDAGKTTYEYSYDKAGNRTCKETDGVKTYYTYDSRNRLKTEKTGNSVTTFHYDANGSLLKQSGGTDTVYTYDVYSRLTGYRKGTQEESYTYDAEGARRSRTAGSAENSTVYFVSDTSGSLSRTLAETDGRGTVRAVYTVADILAAQERNGEVSWYLYDGHGDVRGLLDAEGRVTDTYRYSAYGELLERTGDTENHYLYTGEYYDGTSGLYYLRARYMNPSTGTFLTMDTYEGSIYEPATLHKYLYANGNPVTYSDPGGHFAGMIGSMVSTSISAVLRNIHTLNVMGLISGVTNAAVTGILGGSGDDISRAFIKGYLTGFGLGAVMYIAAAFEIMTIAEFLMISAASNTILNIVMMTAAVISGDSRSVLIYGTLSVLSFITFCQAYNMNGSVTVTGNKGTARIEIKGAGAEDVAVSEGGSSTTRVGRWMSEDEYNKMLGTGQVQMSGDNKIHVANPADIDAFGKQAPKGAIYVEFDVPSNTVFPGGKDGWGIIAGPGSLYDRLNTKKGLPSIEEMPRAMNIELKVKK